MSIDEQIAAAHKRLQERTNRRAGQVLRHLKTGVALDHYEFRRSLGLAFRHSLARRDADEMVAGKITDPLE